MILRILTLALGVAYGIWGIVTGIVATNLLAATLVLLPKKPGVHLVVLPSLAFWLVQSVGSLVLCYGFVRLKRWTYRLALIVNVTVITLIIYRDLIVRLQPGQITRIPLLQEVVLGSLLICIIVFCRLRQARELMVR